MSPTHPPWLDHPNNIWANKYMNDDDDDDDDNNKSKFTSALQ
jgi:hypothetical protein